MTTEQTQLPDAWEAAMDAEYKPRPQVFFGQVDADTYLCVLEKGRGKVRFDPNYHRAEQRRSAITLTIAPLPGSPVEWPVKREMIAESEEWARIVRPSILALGQKLQTINHKWAHVECVPTGRKYTDKQGVEREATTFKFVAVYLTEAACMEAANTFFSPNGKAISEPAPSAPPADSAERNTAAKFLPALWQQAGHDIMKFEEAMQRIPLVRKHFDLTSPEVVSIISPF